MLVGVCWVIRPKPRGTVTLGPSSLSYKLMLRSSRKMGIFSPPYMGEIAKYKPLCLLLVDRVRNISYKDSHIQIQNAGCLPTRFYALDDFVPFRKVALQHFCTIFL